MVALFLFFMAAVPAVVGPPMMFKVGARKGVAMPPNIRLRAEGLLPSEGAPPTLVRVDEFSLSTAENESNARGG